MNIIYSITCFIVHGTKVPLHDGCACCSRALIDLEAKQLGIKAERILLHPFSMSLVLDHNLSAGRSELPSIGVKLTMSELKVSG